MAISPVAILLFSLIIIILPQQNMCSDDEPKDTLNPVERYALREFITKIRYDKSKFTWKDEEHACTWKGVICDPDNTTVLYIRLPAASLVGKIPDNSLGKLPSLRVLSLHYNGLSGELPSDFSNLTTLTRLFLDVNNFSGQLPYIDAKHLIKLNVSVNKFNSSIPHPFSNFPKSLFDVNVYFCGPPTNNTCNGSYDPSPYWIKPVKRHQSDRVIIGVSLASGLVLLILLLCARKTMYNRTKQPFSVASAASSNDKLLFLDGGVHGFRLEDLLTASAEVLGEGSVGTSYKQVVEGKKRTVVVKRLKDVEAKEPEFKRTMEGLREVKNIKVVPLIAYYYSEHEKWLVYDYMPDGSLSARLHGWRRTPLDWGHRMRIALSSAKGLQYLHNAQIVHGNIKSSNILLQQETDNEASLSDYGLNLLFHKPSSPNLHVTVYWAPEVFKTKIVTFESDVYSFGVLLLELLTGKTAKQASLGEEGVHFSNLVELLVWEETKAEIFDVKLGREHNIEMLQLLQIAKDCVSIVPDQRPTMHQVVSMMDDLRLRPSSDDHSKGYDGTPSTDTRDTPSTSTFTP